MKRAEEVLTITLYFTIAYPASVIYEI